MTLSPEHRILTHGQYLYLAISCYIYILLNLGILPCIRHLSPLESSSTLLSSWRLILQDQPSNSSKKTSPYLIQEAKVLISSSSSSPTPSSIFPLASTRSSSRSSPSSSFSSCYLLAPGTGFLLYGSKSLCASSLHCHRGHLVDT